MSADPTKPADDSFRELTDPYRRELQVHCYRLLGSHQDAEEMLQETLPAAWRGLDDYEERDSMRAWLYRIATNRCLNALRDRQRRPRPAPPVPPHFPAPTRGGEPLWLGPYPDSLLDGIPETAPGPEARYETKEAVTLAFVAALQRARSTLDARRPASGETARLPQSPRQRDLVARFAEAVESGDVDAMVALLTDDAVLTMPPLPLEYEGREAIGAFLEASEQGRGAPLQVLASEANAQPALVAYLPDRAGGADGDSDANAATGAATIYGSMVLTLGDDAISAITFFADPAAFRASGLPEILPSRT